MNTPSAGRELQLFFLLLLLVVACSSNALAVPQQTPPRKFLIASDLHFNPMFDPKLVDELNTAPATTWETILERSTSTAFSQYGQDTNWWLLRSALDAMRATLPHPAFILVGGDMLAHRFPSTFRATAKENDPESYRKFTLKTMEFLAQQFQKRFPHTRILITPGNNDDDCGDYTISSDGPFLHDTAELAGKLAQADGQFLHSWEALGSYDIPHPAIRHMRIISLNTIFWSAKYQAQSFGEACAKIPSTAPEDLMTWLEERLSRAQRAHEKVWLMFHIPPGMDGYSTMVQYQSLIKTQHEYPPAQACTAAVVPLWVPKWTTGFDELMGEYGDTVVAAFAGHTHTDDFRVIKSSPNGSNFVLISPAISPIYNQNPAFRVATFGRSGGVIDDSVYYLTNLLFASSTTKGEWAKEYTFSQAWKKSGVTASTLAAVYDEVASDASARADWLRFYNVSSSAAHLPADSTPILYCAIEALSVESYAKCFCPATTPTQ